MRRILKPGGVLLSKTTTKTTILPSSPDVLHYGFTRVLTHSDLDIDRMEFWEWRPEYLRINPLTYVVGVAYEKLVNLNPLLARFRAVMGVGLKKPV